MKDLRKEIEDIRRLLTAGAFRDEQHVRISLVTRICQALNWNVWDPTEYYTEYPVKQYPKNEVTAEYPGRVDVALILTENNPDTAEVFIEVKTPGKLQTEMQKGELQLQKYNFWDKSVISILTDGITWRFYLPSLSGAFGGMLFNQLNLLTDDPDQICHVMERVLDKNNFSKKAKETAQEMHMELKKIRMLESVKEDACRFAEQLDQPKFAMAQSLLKTRYKVSVSLEEIETLWDRSIPGGGMQIAAEIAREGQPAIKERVITSRGINKLPPKPVDEFTFKKVRRIQVLGTWYEVKHWRDVKTIVYNRLISEGLDEDTLSKSYSISKNKKIYHSAATLNEGYYTEIYLGSYDIVWHCYIALYNLGYDPAEVLKIETEAGNK